MKRIDLDFAARPGPSAGWILLGVALVALLDTGASYRHLEAQIAEAEQRAVAPRARAGGHGAETGEAAAAALRDAEKVARTLMLPWDSLFRSVEETTDDGVALLALQPDPQKRELNITGEAKDYDAILAFVTRLDKRGSLRDVHLVRHELREDDPQRPLYFSIIAEWEPEK